MKTVILQRQKSDPFSGTMGHWDVEHGEWQCKTTERPWLDNAPDVSCIPPSDDPTGYTVKMVLSPRHGHRVYQIQGVKGRSGVELDIANVFEQLLGCIALGATHAFFPADSIHPGMPSRGMTGVTSSGPTVLAFIEHMGGEDFKLIILEAA